MPAEHGLIVALVQNDISQFMDIFEQAKHQQPDDMRSYLSDDMYEVAATNGSHQILKYLLEQDNIANRSLQPHGQYLIQIATIHGRLECAKVLSGYGASLTVSDCYNRTPLHIAAIYHHEELYNYLLVNAQSLQGVPDIYGITPAQYFQITVLRPLLTSSYVMRSPDKYKASAAGISQSSAKNDTAQDSGDSEQLLQCFLRNSEPLRSNVARLIEQHKYLMHQIGEYQRQLEQGGCQVGDNINGTDSRYEQMLLALLKLVLGGQFSRDSLEGESMGGLVSACQEAIRSKIDAACIEKTKEVEQIIKQEMQQKYNEIIQTQQIQLGQYQEQLLVREQVTNKVDQFNRNSDQFVSIVSSALKQQIVELTNERTQKQLELEQQQELNNKLLQDLQAYKLQNSQLQAKIRQSCETINNIEKQIELQTVQLVDKDKQILELSHQLDKFVEEKEEAQTQIANGHNVYEQHASQTPHVSNTLSQAVSQGIHDRTDTVSQLEAQVEQLQLQMEREKSVTGLQLDILTSQVTILQEENVQHKKRNARLQQENREIQQSTGLQQLEILNAQTENQELQQRLQQSERMLQEKVSEIQRMTLQVKQLLQQHEDGQSDTHKGAMAAHELHMEQQEFRQTELATQCKAQQQELNNLMKRVQLLEEENEQLKNQIACEEEINNQLQSHIATSSTNGANSQDDLLDSLARQLQQSQTDNDAMQSELEDKERRITQLSDEMRELVNDNIQLTQQLNESTIANNQLQIEHSNLQELSQIQQQEQDQVLASLHGAKEIIAQQMRQYQEQEAELQQLQARSSTPCSILTDIDRIDGQLDKMLQIWNIDNIDLTNNKLVRQILGRYQRTVKHLKDQMGVLKKSLQERIITNAEGGQDGDTAQKLSGYERLKEKVNSQTEITQRLMDQLDLRERQADIKDALIQTLNSQLSQMQSNKSANHAQSMVSTGHDNQYSYRHLEELTDSGRPTAWQPNAVAGVISQWEQTQMFPRFLTAYQRQLNLIQSMLLRGKRAQSRQQLERLSSITVLILCGAACLAQIVK